MKRILTLVIIAILFSACKQSQENTNLPKDVQIKEDVRFKLFPTENMWTFLKLDTQSGKIWQVQYSVGNDYRGEVDLNVNSLLTSDSLKNGRFTLYPTKNFYNFVLLDQYNGKMWQVQWSMENEHRLITPIN
jgi:PBP1b-binding outer membrane lipoprotein LpoB